ncbi:peptide ligase PGM1-related protein [Rhodopila globiformis]|uniref:peptide ligase PGM1-related protein n=1 Tax=Rhodopila globiformis TaxID=1071 RepID=UPI001304B1A2|nr:peptide ligase PGM1-related protein [Rhodopila globiformis]
MIGLTSNVVPGSAEECLIFKHLQAKLPVQFRTVFPDRTAPRTVVVVPSLSIDQDVIAKIAGAHHYEERMLGMLMLLRLPRTRLIYLTSQPIPEAIIDYYLHLLQGVPAQHARNRLTLLSCFDGSPRPLTAKLLERPRLMARLRDAIGDPAAAHIAAYVVSGLERSLAVRLGIPIYGCDPALQKFGSKSGGRQIMREAGVPMPDGIEDLTDETGIAAGLAALKSRDPGLRRAVVKLNDGFSGEGNALFRFDGAPTGSALDAWIAARLPQLAFEARGMTWDTYLGKAREMGAIVEAFVAGEEKRSPSVQFRIDPFGEIEYVSTHDQVLGGPGGQVYLGCAFPADEAYRLAIQTEGAKVARLLAGRGVLGRFGVDFVSVREGNVWRNYGIEINLRKGGTTHPFLMLQFLTGGRYDPASGLFRTPPGQPRFYYASDNLESPRYRGLTPADLVDIAVLNGLHYDGTTQEGVVFHLIGALSEFGKLGVVCVGSSPDRALALYRRTVDILDREQDGAA